MGPRSTGLQTAHRTDRGRIARRRQRPNNVGMNRPMELGRTRTVGTNIFLATLTEIITTQGQPPSVRKQNDDRHTLNIYKQSKQHHNHRTEHQLVPRLGRRCNYRRRVARDSLLRSLSGTGRSRSDASSGSSRRNRPQRPRRFPRPPLMVPPLRSRAKPLRMTPFREQL